MSDDNNQASAAATNPRSCITCRRRKVKCDKRHPCANCLRARIECVFPGPGRAPRKSRKPPDAELLERLRRLEGVVQNLNAQVEEHEHEAAERERESTSRKGSAAAPAEPCHVKPTRSASVAVDNSVEGLESRFGRLVVENGRSRYINNSFWASLNNEVEDLKAVLIEPSDDEDDDNSNSGQSPSSDHTGQHQGFILGYSSTVVDMRALHPTPEVAHQFWETYQSSIEPLVKVLHVPTFSITFADAVARPEKVSRGLETLLFAIYYGAVTSTPAEECLSRWGEDRASLLNRYRFALEQALARANFLYCDEMVILQAFVVFLILLRRNDDARKIWTLTGLAVRIAQTLGIHRDGSHFGLEPFEIEMRRRLWWQVCVLDARSSEDHGCDPTIVEAQFDAKMPLNVNDTDLHPGMASFPQERQGFTDMTFSLIRFEVANILRRIQYIPPGPVKCNELFTNLSIEDKESWITDCHQQMEQKYLKDCDMTIPLCWVTATISRLIMSKMWLIVYHPYQRKDGGASLPQATKDRLFITSLENVEYSILLETEARTMKWSWLFRTFVQWHAIAFLLSELCVRTKGEAVERAWRALEATAGRWWFPLNDSAMSRKSQQGTLWKPLRKLLDKARAARERELLLERASQAIRSGQPMMIPGFPQALDQMPTPDSMAQPSPENLDRLLRPSAPRLGEKMTIASPTLLPESPPILNTHAPITGRDGDSFAPAQRPHPAMSPGKEFQNMASYGLDNLMLDIMGDTTYEGTSLSDYAQLDPNPHAKHVPMSLQPTFPVAPQPMPDTDAAQLAAASYQAAQPTDDWPNDTSMDGGNIDWTMWDDMVSQYGIEGQAVNNTNSTGSGHLGLMHFL